MTNTVLDTALDAGRSEHLGFDKPRRFCLTEHGACSSIAVEQLAEQGRGAPMPRRKVLTLPVVLTEHVFDKVRSIDMALAEFEELLGCGEINEE